MLSEGFSCSLGNPLVPVLVPAGLALLAFFPPRRVRNEIPVALFLAASAMWISLSVWVPGMLQTVGFSGGVDADAALLLSAEVLAGSAAAIALLWAARDYQPFSRGYWPGYEIKDSLTRFSAHGGLALTVLGTFFAGLAGLAALAVLVGHLPLLTGFAGLIPDPLAAALQSIAVSGFFRSEVVLGGAVVLCLVNEVRHALAESARIINERSFLARRLMRPLSIAALLLLATALVLRATMNADMPLWLWFYLAGCVCLWAFNRRKRLAAWRVRRIARRRGQGDAMKRLSTQQQYELSLLSQHSLRHFQGNRRGGMFYSYYDAALALVDEWETLGSWGLEARLERTGSLKELQEALARLKSDNKYESGKIHRRIEEVLAEGPLAGLTTDAQRLAFIAEWPQYPDLENQALACLKDQSLLTAQLLERLCKPDGWSLLKDFASKWTLPPELIRALPFAKVFTLFDHDSVSRAQLEGWLAGLGIKTVVTEIRHEPDFDSSSSSYDYAAYNTPEPWYSFEVEFTDELFTADRTLDDRTAALLDARHAAQGFEQKDWEGLAILERARKCGNPALLEWLERRLL